jgi:hypothetical protein
MTVVANLVALKLKCTFSHQEICNVTDSDPEKPEVR